MTKKAPKGYSDDALFDALGSDDYSVCSPAQDFLDAALDALGSEAAQRVQQLAKRAARDPRSRVRDNIGIAGLPIVARSTKGQLPQWCWPLVSPYGKLAEVRKLWSRVPLEVRTEALRRAVAESGNNSRFAELVDLAPEATTAILDVYRASEHPRWALVNDPELAAAASRSKRVRQLLAAYKDELAAKPKPIKVAGPFAFVDPIVIGLADFLRLDAIGKAQWRAAASGYVGVNVKDPKGFVARLRTEGLNAGDAEMRRWTVKRGEVHVYDAWVVWVDNGVLCAFT